MTKFLLFFFTILLLSCQQKGGTQDMLIESIVNEDPNKIFTLYDDIFIFGKSDGGDGKLIYMDVRDLRRLYLSDSLFYKMDYHKFISGTINQKIIFDCNYADWCFNINEEITSFLKTNSFSDFLKTYTSEFTSTGELYVRNEFSFEKKMTIIYYLFQRNYYTIYDDYLGFYITRKIELLHSP